MEVPVYGDTRVAAAPLPNARVEGTPPIEAFGGGQAAAGVVQAVKGIAGEVADIASKERAKAVDTMTQEGYTKIVAEKNRLVYDPKVGALQRKGKDAFATPEEYGKRFDDYAAKVEQDMPDVQARQMFRHMRQREGIELAGVLDRHVAQQSEQLHEETFHGLMSTLTDDAVANFDQQPGKVQENLKMMKAAADNYAVDKGITGEDSKPVREAMWKTITNKLHIGVINRMVAMGEGDAARSYYNANKDGISGLDMDAIEKEIKKTDVFKQKDNYLTAAGLVDKAGKGADPAMVVPGFDSLSSDQRDALKRRFSNEQSATANHEFYALSQAQVADLDRAEFETKYWSRFDADHRRAADKYWQSAVDAQRTGADSIFKSIRGDKDMIVAALRKNKIVPSTGELKGNDAETAQRFEDYVDEKFKTFTHENKRNPKDEEKQAIVHRAMLDTVFTDGGWFGFDKQKPRGVLSESEVKSAYVPMASIPRTDRLLLVNLARARQTIKPEALGGPTDDRAMHMLQDRIQQAYAAAAGGASKAQIIEIMSGGNVAVTPAPGSLAGPKY